MRTRAQPHEINYTGDRGYCTTCSRREHGHDGCPTYSPPMFLCYKGQHSYHHETLKCVRCEVRLESGHGDAAQPQKQITDFPVEQRMAISKARQRAGLCALCGFDGNGHIVCAACLMEVIDVVKSRKSA